MTLKVKDFKNILQNGYKDKKKENISNYKLDKSLSGKRVQVYHNPDKNEVVVNHTGTNSFNDIISDTKLMLGFKNNNRFNHSKKIQKQAQEKYSNSKIITTGHSLGSKLAEEAVKSNKHKNQEVITLNKAHHPFDNTKHKNQTDIRTQLDPVSIFNNKNDISIKSKTINPVKEHSTDTLNRLPQDMIIGSGINDYKIYQKAKQIADKIYKKSSAYKSGFIVKKYKELGGTFSGDKPKNIGLDRWFKERWKDVGNEEYPVYRPTIRITKDTPLTPDEIDPNNLKAQIELKQKIKGSSNLPSFKKIGTGINDYSNPKIVFEKAKKIYGKNLKIELSDRKDKKYKILNPNTNKWFYFGQIGFEDFTKHKDELRRQRFLKRNSRWKDFDKYSPAFASYSLLW